MNATRILGWPRGYNYVPLPPILSALLNLPKEEWMRRLATLYFTGPKGIIICDPVGKLSVPDTKLVPTLYDMHEHMFKRERMYEDFAIPFDKGIPPPRALLTSVVAPFYKEAKIRDLIKNPNNLPKEYRDLLGSEAGIDEETGRIPPYIEVPR